MHGIYVIEGYCSWYHENLGSKKSWEATHQTIATLSNIIVPFTLCPIKHAHSQRVIRLFKRFFLQEPNGKHILVEVNDVGFKVGYEQIPKSKLSVMKNQLFGDYITEKPSDKFTRYNKCMRHKLLCDVHHVGLNPYNAHQQNYMKYVNKQEAYRQKLVHE